MPKQSLRSLTDLELAAQLLREYLIRSDPAALSLLAKLWPQIDWPRQIAALKAKLKSPIGHPPDPDSSSFAA